MRLKFNLNNLKVVILTPNVEEIKKKRFIYRDSHDELKYLDKFI